MKYLILLFPITVYASGSHDHETINITNNVTLPSMSINVPSPHIPDLQPRAIKTKHRITGVALGIASAQHAFDWSTDKSQLSVGIGQYDGSEAISVGVGRRFGEILVNGSLGKEGSKTGLGAGFLLRF